MLLIPIEIEKSCYRARQKKRYPEFSDFVMIWRRNRLLAVGHTMCV